MIITIIFFEIGLGTEKNTRQYILTWKLIPILRYDAVMRKGVAAIDVHILPFHLYDIQDVDSYLWIIHNGLFAALSHIFIF